MHGILELLFYPRANKEETMAIRVKSREELKQRILQGVREMNLAPVVVRWTKFDLGLA